MFRLELYRKKNTHLMSRNFFPENCAVYKIMWKSMGREGQATDNNIIWLDNYYRHTFRILNNYCFSAAIIATRTRLNNTLYVHCLFCLFLLSRFVDWTTNCCETVNCK